MPVVIDMTQTAWQLWVFYFLIEEVVHNGSFKEKN
jgi:hypothetical protein